MSDIIWLQEIGTEPVGGKAHGLKKLLYLGLNVPSGFVIVEPQAPNIGQAIEPFLDALSDAAKAVRSSALDEDGQIASFAGQFQSVLNVKGNSALLAAIEQCVESAKAAQVKAYSEARLDSARLKMSVIVQEMVDAEVAGVLFTANPVNQRRDQLVISAVQGLGERLVSGEVAGEVYLLSRSGQIVTAPEAGLLSEEAIEQLYRQSVRIEKSFGYPIDLEWAIDKEGKLFWLQSRPITTLSRAHFNELDTPVEQPDTIFTRCNVGEMMPGAVTPLTWSVFGHAIEQGLQDFYYSVGALRKKQEQPRYIQMFYHHLFINMSALYDFARHLMLAEKKNIELSIMGRTLPRSDLEGKAGFGQRLRNLIHYARYLNSADRRLRELERLQESFQIALELPLEPLYNALDHAKQVLCEAYSHHYVTSSQSGALHTALMQILSQGASEASVEQHGEAASLLIDIDNVESAGVVKAIEALADAIASHPDYATIFVNASPKEVLTSLNRGQAVKISALFNDFLSKHGHRCVREAELREKDWQTEPEVLISLLQTKVKHQASAGQKQSRSQPRSQSKASYQENLARVLKKSNLTARLALKYLLPRARAAIGKREKSKSLCIKIQSVIKQAYLQLGHLLTEQSLLNDADQVFFLTHTELGELIASKAETWQQLAEERRAFFPQLMDLDFEEVCIGTPEPLISQTTAQLSDGTLTGIPVSNGIAQAKARIVNTLADAHHIQPGEIMIAPYTDIGWTPYFSIIKGLITEIGSPLSHGAVVAREYGIPAIVNVKGARTALKNGEEIVLDGGKGVVKRVAGDW